MSGIFLFSQDQVKFDGVNVDVQEILHGKLKDISEQIKKDGISIPDVLRPLTQHSILQCVIGPSHLAFRLEDGRVCRVSYYVKSDKQTPKAELKRRLGQSETSRYGSSRTSSYNVRAYRSPLNMLRRTTDGIGLLREMQRQGIFLARPVPSPISASEVPENLIQECQTVLEGKSREVIVKELQHTNLDVNMAVNNLLSRDDEAEQSNTRSTEGSSGRVTSATDEWDEESVDLLSIFEFPDGNVLFDSNRMIQDELVEPPTSPRQRGEGSDQDTGFLGRRKRRRLESQFSSRGTESANTNGSDSSNSDGSKPAARHSIQLGDHLEFWMSSLDRDLDLRFTHIAGLHSELVGLSSHGELHQWRWTESRPFSAATSASGDGRRVLNRKDPHMGDSSTIGENWSSNGSSRSVSPKSEIVYFHPHTLTLGLLDETVVNLCGFATRATVQTASGKFATWMDESLSRLLPGTTDVKHSSFEHPATVFHELRDEHVIGLFVAPLITVVQCKSGAIFWWGIFPPCMRRRVIEKSHQHKPSSPKKVGKKSTRRSGNRGGSSSGHMRDLVPGTFVRMKSAPIFHAGAVAFTLVNGVPKVGTLLEDAWHTTDICRFRIQSSSHLMDNLNSPPPDDPVQHALTCPHALNSTIGAVQSSLSNLPYTTTPTAASPNPTEATTSASSFQEMPPPPSPASSTCSDQSGPVRVSPGTFKRKKASSSSSDNRMAGENESGGRSGRGRSIDHDMPPLHSTRRSNDQPQASSNADLPKPTTPSEENWFLNDVVFVEDGRTQPIGIVLKTDGNIAAVKFLKEQERACLVAKCAYSPVCNLVSSCVSTASMITPCHPTNMLYNNTQTNFADTVAWVNDCRLLRKEDLTVVRYADSARVPEFVQRTPRRVRYTPRSTVQSDSSKTGRTFQSSNSMDILTLSIENSRIHLLIRERQTVGGKLSYAHCITNLTGKVLYHYSLPKLTDYPRLTDDTCGFSLVGPCEYPFLLRDPHGLAYSYPVVEKSGSTNSFNSSRLLDLPPIQSAAFSWSCTDGKGSQATQYRSIAGSHTENHNTNRSLIGLIIVQDSPLMQHVLRANDTQVERLLSTDHMPGKSFDHMATEMVSGKRNLLHMAVSMCAPQSNQESKSEWMQKLDSVFSSPVDLTGSLIPPKPDDALGKKVAYGVKRGSARSSTSLWSSLTKSTGGTNSGLNMHELFIRSPIEAATTTDAGVGSAAHSTDDLTTTTTTTIHRAPSLANGTNFWHLPPVRKDELTLRIGSHRIVRLLIESPHLRPFLPILLSAQNVDKLTPFMMAVKLRAYTVARFLYQTIQSMISLNMVSVKSLEDPTRAFLFPVEAELDDSPLFLLCHNDTCSFTWTGPDHIRQDIFECRTCGLMDSLCCCTECARVCHRDHDCRLKRTSPTAYCDCWEKCRCKSLIAGVQSHRQELFHRLLQDTGLIRFLNSRREHLLLFLVKRVERQLREQKQHRPSRRRVSTITASTTAPTTISSSANQNTGWDTAARSSSSQPTSNPEEPDHDLDPPRFSKDALNLTLDCANAVESILNMDVDSHTSEPTEEEQVLLSQGGTNQLDDFIYTLICKCPPQFVDTLIETLLRQLNDDIPLRSNPPEGNTSSAPELEKLNGAHQRVDSKRMKEAAARFVRSVARIFVALTLELSPDHKKKKSRLLLAQPAPLDICRHIFSRLVSVSLIELPVLAVGLLTPVRTSTLRPSSCFSPHTHNSDALLDLDQFFTHERQSTTRRALLDSNPPRSDASELTASEWHNLLTRMDDRQSATSSNAGRGVHTTQVTQSNSQLHRPSATTVTTASRQTVTSTLRVQLPLASTSFSQTRSADNQLSQSQIHSPSPSVATCIGDPSIFTRQMQSTIVDIDRENEAISGPSSAIDGNASNWRFRLEIPSTSRRRPSRRDPMHGGDSDGESRPKRRHTMVASSSSSPERLRLADELPLMDDDGDRTLYNLGEEDSTSQASSTNATIATTVGSNLDTLDAASDITNFSYGGSNLYSSRADQTLAFPSIQTSSQYSGDVPTTADASAELGFTSLLASDDNPYSQPVDTTVVQYFEDQDDEMRQNQLEERQTQSQSENVDRVDEDDDDDDGSDGLISDYEDDEDEEDDVGNGLDADEHDEDEENETDEEECDDDESVYDFGQLVDNDEEEEEDDDDEHDDDSSHHSDASSCEGRSRSISPTWTPWATNSMFNRINTRTTSNSDPSTTSNTTNSNISISRRVSTSNTTSLSTLTTATTSTSAVSSTSIRPTTSRRGQTLLSFLPTSTSSTSSTSLVISGGGTTSVSRSNGDALTSQPNTETASVFNSQVRFSRAFGVLIRVISDLVAEACDEMRSTGLRRCASAPVSVHSTPSVYEQQRQLPVYITASSSLTSTSLHPLLLSSPLSTTNATGRSLQLCPTVADLSSESSGRSHDLNYLTSTNRPPAFRTNLNESTLAELVSAFGVTISPVWEWLTQALDNLEAQLRYSSAWRSRFHIMNDRNIGSEPGEQTTAARSTSRVPGNRLLSSSSLGAVSSVWDEPSWEADTISMQQQLEDSSLSQRSTFLAYLFSVMRATSADHGDGETFLCPALHKHLAYVLDALLYFFKAFESSWPSGLTHQLLLPPEPVIAPLSTPVDANNLVSTPIQVHMTDDPEMKQNSSTISGLAAPIVQRGDAFFRRSESVLSLSGLGLDLVDTVLSESIPLALQPQRLHSNSSRTELFGPARYVAVQPTTTSWDASLSSDYLPIHLNVAGSGWGRCVSAGGSRIQHLLESENDTSSSSITHLTRRKLLVGGAFLDAVGNSATLLSRWCLSLEYFGRHFSYDVGAESRSYILEVGGFSVKESRFRKQMERLRAIARGEVVLDVDRERTSLILNTVKQLNAEYAKRQSSSTTNTTLTGTPNADIPPLGIGRYSGTSGSGLRTLGSNYNQLSVSLLLGTSSDSPLLGTLFGSSPISMNNLNPTNSFSQSSLLLSHRMKVSFKDEFGEGTGVIRSFFTAFMEAVLSADNLPLLESLLQPAVPNTSTTTSTTQSNSLPPFHHRHYTSLSRYTSTSRPITLGQVFSATPSTTAHVTTPSPLTVSSGLSESYVHSVPSTINTFYSYPSLARYGSRRGRAGTWRRAGGLSASAAPFVPTTATSIPSVSVPNLLPMMNRSPGSELLPSSPVDRETESSQVFELSIISPGTSPVLEHETIRDSSNIGSSSILSSTDRMSSLSNAEEDTDRWHFVGNRLYGRVRRWTNSDEMCARITGMLLELSPSEHIALLINDEALNNRVGEARAVLLMSDSGEGAPAPTQERPYSSSTNPSHQSNRDLQSGNQSSITINVHNPNPLDVNEEAPQNGSIVNDPLRVPLFWQPGLQGYYFPRAIPGINVSTGESSQVNQTMLATRYSIYRAVGRVIGFCLLTCETCPLHLSRPVLKYILGRVLRWHDFAFYDPTTYEGLRHLLQSATTAGRDSVADYNLTFSIIPTVEEGGLELNYTHMQQTHSLIPDGENVEVTESNAFDFVKRYTEFKMLEAVRAPLEHLRQGVFDVLPRNALDGLTAEDLRLLLNGAGEIDIESLVGYTTFVDETGTSSVDLSKTPDNVSSVTRLKRWFWSTVRGMDVKQRQNLLYFWTSSPTLPASAQGFQPKPSITIRPPNDHHLPTANTCISRLYIPLYSSKHILRDKLLQAIEVKYFGFV